MKAKAKSLVTFEEPESKVAYDWAGIAEELRAAPGQWAKIFDHDRTSLATAIRIHGIKALDPDIGFEVRTRNNTRGEVRMCTLYLRYNPTKERG